MVAAVSRTSGGTALILIFSPVPIVISLISRSSRRISVRMPTIFLYVLPPSTDTTPSFGHLMPKRTPAGALCFSSALKTASAIIKVVIGALSGLIEGLSRMLIYTLPPDGEIQVRPRRPLPAVCFSETQSVPLPYPSSESF